MNLIAKNINFSYDKFHVLSNITLQVNEGEILSILGPNGTGKTTLLKCISHILTPNDGSVYLENENIAQMKATQRAQQIAYVPQSVSAIFSTSVIDTIMMGRIPFSNRIIRKEDKEIVFDIIEKFQLSDIAFKNINHLSGGQRQRVYIARALAQEPKILLLDEPTSSLDMKNQLFVLELIEQLVKEKNLAVAMSIHDLNLCAMFSNKIAMLKNKNLASYGTVKEVLTYENIKDVYGVETEILETNTSFHIALKKEQ